MVVYAGYTERFRDAMEKSGKNPDDSKAVRSLAGELNITYQAMAKVLNGGTKMMAADNNVRAAKLLAVNSEWLATGEGPREPVVAKSPQVLSEWAAKLAADAETLPSAKRRHLRLILNALMSDDPEAGEDDDPEVRTASSQPADHQATAEPAPPT